MTRQNLPQLRDASTREPLRRRRLRACRRGGRRRSRDDLRLRLRGLDRRWTPARRSRSGACRPGWCPCPRSTFSSTSPTTYARRSIGKAPVRIGVEAAVRFGWDAVIGEDGGFIGMKGFGASAPIKDLYPYFGITADAVVEAAVKRHNA